MLRAGETRVGGVEGRARRAQHQAGRRQEYQYRQTDMTPQLLALCCVARCDPAHQQRRRHRQHDQGANELGWNVKVVGSLARRFRAGAEDRRQGCVQEHRRDQLRPRCPNERQARGSRVRRAGQAHKPEAFDRRRCRSSLWYDAVYVLKAAVEAPAARLRTDRRRMARSEPGSRSRHQQRADREQVDALPRRAGCADHRLSDRQREAVAGARAPSGAQRTTNVAHG
jgi:hypothetical protein